MNVIRIAHRVFTIEDYFISNHNRGRLVDNNDWEEYNEAKEMYKAALIKFSGKYHKEK